jgi:hypothetical protein
MRRRYPVAVLLMLLLALTVMAYITATAGAFPTWPNCGACHNMANTHAVPAHAPLLAADCANCHPGGSPANDPTPSICGGCHGGVSVILTSPTHVANNCGTTPGCHGFVAGAEITSITPASALPGVNVTIAGTGFGAAQGAGAVMFGATAAAVVTWSDTSIVATVPAIAPGPVQVTVTPDGGVASAGFAFTVEAEVGGAVITSITPASALPGVNVTIAGTGFGAAQGAGAVMFGATAAAVVTWSDTSIVATVPAIAPGPVQVTVTPDGGVASAGFAFTVLGETADTTAPVTTATGARNNGWYRTTRTITLTAVDEAGGSGVETITYVVNAGTPVVEAAATAQVVIAVNATTHENDGRYEITFFATDVAGNVEATNTLVVNIDTRKPRTRALRAVTVHRNQFVNLRFRVNESDHFQRTAQVTIRIRNSAGRVVKVLNLGQRRVNANLARSWRATLRPGIYRYNVYARDDAGNRQANIASARIRILPVFTGPGMG